MFIIHKNSINHKIFNLIEKLFELQKKIHLYHIFFLFLFYLFEDITIMANKLCDETLFNRKIRTLKKFKNFNFNFFGKNFILL